MVEINRPQARNAIDDAVAAGIEAGLDELESDSTLHAAVLTGAGGYFSSGMDLKAFAAGQRGATGRGGFAGIVRRPLDKVLIAAIEGFALAGGLEIALSCDLLVASREARFGIPEVRRGLTAESGALLRLPRRIPHHLAMEMALTGEPIDAETAYRFRLVNRLTTPGEAVAVALSLGIGIAENAPLAVAASKQVVLRSREWTEEEQWERQAPITGAIADSVDALEGAVAFAEKRSPVWRGR